MERLHRWSITISLSWHSAIHWCLGFVSLAITDTMLCRCAVVFKVAGIKHLIELMSTWSIMSARNLSLFHQSESICSQTEKGRQHHTPVRDLYYSLELSVSTKAWSDKSDRILEVPVCLDANSMFLDSVNIGEMLLRTRLVCSGWTNMSETVLLMYEHTKSLPFKRNPALWFSLGLYGVIQSPDLTFSFTTGSTSRISAAQQDLDEISGCAFAASTHCTLNVLRPLYRFDARLK